jgi:hypothetical protein
MSILNIAIVAGALALSSAALAQPARLNDAQYIALARCQALMTSPALGAVDSRAVDHILKAQAAGRPEQVFVRAEEVRFDATQAARHSGPYGKAALVAERDGPCRAFGGGALAAASNAAGSTRAN